ncbi:MAG: alpha/beta hydrolase [Bacteroidetes bacterium]|nr:alpha/beta hydrolase [Bacteroidota bacterium]MDA1121987.1 alpha/beta hydrolase [Bacteroidota bacterium]
MKESFQTKKFAVENDSGKLSYLQKGTGKEALVTLHGFGQNGIAFQSFDIFWSSFTLYHFDLPLHGESKWKSLIVDKKDIQQLFEQFLDNNRINRFSVAAFSLGARVVFTLLEVFPERLDRIILIAPDGINVNIWYRLVTLYSPFRRLFKSMVINPRIYFYVFEVLKNLGIINKSTLKFVKVHMSTPEKRDKVYLVWSSYKNINTKRDVITALLNEHDIKVTLCLGTYDRVVPPNKFRAFAKSLHNCSFCQLETGHNHLLK